MLYPAELRAHAICHYGTGRQVRQPDGHERSARPAGRRGRRPANDRCRPPDVL